MNTLVEATAQGGYPMFWLILGGVGIALIFFVIGYVVGCNMTKAVFDAEMQQAMYEEYGKKRSVPIG